MNFLLLVEVITFAFVAWLGCYLISRDIRNPVTTTAGLGALFYSFVLAITFLGNLDNAPRIFGQLRLSFLVLPAALWASALFFLERENSPSQTPAGIKIFAVLTLLISGLMLLPQSWDSSLMRPTPSVIAVLGVWLAAPLISAIFTLVRITRSGASALVAIRAIILATLFFTLGAGLIIFPLGLFPQEWVLLAIAIDFELLGIAVAWLDAFNLGEKFAPDFTRSLIIAVILSSLFGGQIAFVIALSTGATFPMVLILHLTILAAIAVSVFSDELQNVLELLILKRSSQKRSELNYREASKARLRAQPLSKSQLFSEELFYKHTRQALSNFGNLPKLISNPLLNLPIVTSTIQERDLQDSPLERAKVFKNILTEAIIKLKPPGSKMFDDTDEWRFFNALYFPYVKGIRPYRRKNDFDEHDLETRQAMEWFRVTVPERTLYNWQKSAAKLVAQQLKEHQHEII